MDGRNIRLKKTLQKLILYFLHFILLLIVFLPLLFAFTSSFRPLGDIYKYINPLSWKTFIPVRVTLDAYKSIFTNYGFDIAIFNSLFATGVTILFGIIFNGMAGFAFAKFDFPYKKFLFMIVLLSFMIPFELITFNLYSMMIKFQWVNSFKALIIPSISNGMIIFLFRQYFMGFPDYMLEAAKIDGYGWFSIFFRIVMPNSKAICVSAGLVLFMSQWESFLWPVLITRTKEMNTVQIALSSFRTQYTKNWNEIFAGSIIAFLIPILIIIPLQKFYTEGITNVGTKE